MCMLMAPTYTNLPKELGKRPFSLADAARAWGVTSKTAWKRLRALVQAGEAVQHGRSLYAGRHVAELPQLPDRARTVLDAVASLQSYRLALSGLDVLTPYLHYLPARYPHLLLVEARGLEDVQRALARAGLLALDARALAAVWRANPPSAVVVLKRTANWHGVPRRARSASLERAFLDVLVVVRRHQYPFPAVDLARMWSEFDPTLRRRVAKLGRHLQVRPFYDPESATTVVPNALRVEQLR